MITLRCTRKLLKRLGGVTTEDPSPSTTIFGDWYANVLSLSFRGKSVVMFVNEPTLLAVFIPGRGAKKMLPVFRARAMALMRTLDLPEDCIKKEAEEMADLQLAPTASRSVLGAMNDMAQGLCMLAERKASADEIDWDEMEIYYSEWIHGIPLAYGYPRDAAAERCRAYLKSRS